MESPLNFYIILNIPTNSHASHVLLHTYQIWIRVLEEMHIIKQPVTPGIKVDRDVMPNPSCAREEVLACFKFHIHQKVVGQNRVIGHFISQISNGRSVQSLLVSAHPPLSY